MGLGLTVADRIISGHDGTLYIRSEPGSFTEVCITLRVESLGNISSVAENTEMDSSSAVVVKTDNSARGRILILDDEPAVGNVLSLALTRDGWAVDIALEGEEAISKWQQAFESGEAYSLLIADLTIPGGMGGREALENIRSFDPHAVALASSGYSDDPVMEHPREFGFVEAVAKPYELKRMLDIVRHCAKFSRSKT